MEQEYQEYVTFHITARDGSDVEMAVVDEFDFENQHYVVGAVVETCRFGSAAQSKTAPL